MAIFKVPRITTLERTALILTEAEIVYDTDLKVYFGGDGLILGGFPIGGAAQNTESFTLDSADILAKQIQLASTPMFPSLVTLLPDGGIYQRYGIDFTVIGDMVNWDGLGLDNFLEVGDTIVVSY